MSAVLEDGFSKEFLIGISSMPKFSDISTASESGDARSSSNKGLKKTTSSLKGRQSRTLYLPPGRRFQNFSSEVQESILKALQEKTLQVLKHHPDGISVPEFLTTYKKEFRKNLDVQAFGFTSYIECFDRIEGLEIVERNNRYFVVPTVAIFCKQPIDTITENRNNNDESSSITSMTSLSSHLPWVELDDRNLSSPDPFVVQQEDADRGFILPPTPCKLTTTINARRRQHPSCPETVAPDYQNDWELVSSEAEETNVNGRHSDENSSSITSHSSHLSSLRTDHRNLSSHNPFVAQRKDADKGFIAPHRSFKFLTAINERSDRLPPCPKTIAPHYQKSNWDFASKEAEETSLVSIHKVENTVFNMEVVIYRIRKMLKAQVHGIRLENVHHDYLLNYDDNFSLDSFGFPNMIALVLKIADDVPLKIMDVQGVTTVFYYIDMQSVLPPAVPDPVEPLSKGGIPTDAVISSREFEKQAVLTLSDNEFFPIKVSQIYNPGDLWIQLRGRGTTYALAELSTELDTLYKNREGNFYMMKNQDIVLDAVCAAPYCFDERWYRCIITDASLDSASVKVLYVDFGTKGDVQKSDLRYLRQRFMALPSQGIRARMAFVQPKSNVMDTWDNTLEDRLMDLCLEKDLIARISRNTIYPEFLSLWFCDCSGENKVCLNKLLADEGLVEFSQDDLQQNPFLPFCSVSNPKFQDMTGISHLSGPLQSLKYTIPSQVNCYGKYRPLLTSS